MDKARELLNMGVIKGIERSKAGEIIGNYETTRQLLSLPPGTPISFNNAAYISSSSSTHSIGSSRRGSGSNQSSDTNIHSTGITMSTVAATGTPTTITLQSSGGAQQIRQLLSIDGRLVYPSAATTVRPRSVSTNSSPTEKGSSPVGPSPVPTATVPLNPSPGKSLIKKTSTSTLSATGASQQIVSAVSRQLLQSPSLENPTNKAISIVLNSNTSKATETAIINSLTSQGLGVKTSIQEISSSSVPTAYDNLVTPRVIENSAALASKITPHGTLSKPVIIRSSGANKEADGTYIMRSSTSGSMQWPSHSIVAVNTTSPQTTSTHTPTVSDQLFAKDISTKPRTELCLKDIIDTSTRQVIALSTQEGETPTRRQSSEILQSSPDELSSTVMDSENQPAHSSKDKTTPPPDVLSIGSSTLSADFSAEEAEPILIDVKLPAGDTENEKPEGTTPTPAHSSIQPETDVIE